MDLFIFLAPLMRCPASKNDSCFTLQSGSHVQCSESFYKDWIETEISSRGRNDKEAMKKTYETLMRMQQEEAEQVPKHFF